MVILTHDQSVEREVDQTLVRRGLSDIFTGNDDGSGFGVHAVNRISRSDTFRREALGEKSVNGIAFAAR
jgi:hypothetical protein